MAEKRVQQAPTGMAGLVRYFEEDKSILKMKPEYVILGSALVSEVVLLLQNLYSLSIAFMIIYGLLLFFIWKK